MRRFLLLGPAGSGGEASVASRTAPAPQRPSPRVAGAEGIRLSGFSCRRARQERRRRSRRRGGPGGFRAGAGGAADGDAGPEPPDSRSRRA